MDNDTKFTVGWRAAIVIALLFSLAAFGVRVTVGPFSIGPVSVDDQSAERDRRERALEERINKMERYLYEKVAPIVEAQKAPKDK